MVFRRRNPMRRRAKRRGAWRGKFRRARTMYGSRTFTEMVEASDIQVNAGGIFSVKFNSLPQATQYSSLYKQFCIKKLQVILLPNYGATDPSLIVSGTQNFRLAFAVDDTPSLNVPSSELDVITANGSKVVVGQKKIVINCKPKPDLSILAPGIGYVAMRQRSAVWLNTDATEVGNSGTGLTHYGIRYWVTGGPISPAYSAFKTFFKVTIGLRDPA